MDRFQGCGSDELGWLELGDSQDPPVCCVDGEALGRGLLTDQFDATALNYAALDESGEVVGSIRVVLDGPPGLSLESCWPLDGFRRGRHLAELCRLAVALQRRRSRLPLQLMKAGWQGARRCGVTHVLVDAFVDDVQRAHAIYRKSWPGGSGQPDK